jgi:acetate kinase
LNCQEAGVKPIDVIKDVTIFKDLSDQSISELAENAEIKNFSEGESVIKFSEVGSLFGVVISGEFEASGKSAKGKKQRYMKFKPRDYFGEMSLMTGEPTTAEVSAVIESSALLIPHSALYPIIAREPSLTAALARTISKRLVDRERNRAEQERLEEARRAQEDPYGLKKFPLPEGGKILTINCGSSSLKYSLFDSNEPDQPITGLVERIGLEGTRHVIEHGDDKREEQMAGNDFEAAFNAMIESLGGEAALESVNAVGHRVVHGGTNYGHAVVINETLMKGIRECEKLAPLHIPSNLKGIEHAMELMPNIPHVAVFDTGFHRSIPRHAHVYGVPYDLYENENVRTFGFHGMSHKFVAMQSATFLKRPFNELKLITCHLGNGASMAAVNHGQSIDTSMGMTPLAGLIMGTRSGDLDPGAILHIMKEKKLSAEDMEKVLMKESGLLGLSGISSDMREVLKAADEGNDRALLTIQSFCYRIKKFVGAYWAALGGLDALIFTGGIGENSSEIRARVCQDLSGLGIIIDEDVNRNPKFNGGEAADVSTQDSRVRVLVVPTDEERMIARETARALSRVEVNRIMQSREVHIPIGVSAHHVHLTKEHVEALFGEGHTLTSKSPLSQPGQFACEEKVTLVGPKGKVERVRVLGPERKATQVEISRTEEFQLGIDAPIRLSGDIEGTPGVTIIGDRGEITIEEGVICAKRHIHMTPEDALGLGLRDRDVIMVEVEGPRSLIFGDIDIRVNPNYKLEMHIDTDEANAAELNTGMTASFHSIQSRS